MTTDSTNYEDNPWRKPGVAQQVAHDLGIPEGTVLYEHTRKPLSKPTKGGIAHSMKGRPGRVRHKGRKPFTMPM